MRNRGRPGDGGRCTLRPHRPEALGRNEQSGEHRRSRTIPSGCNCQPIRASLPQFTPSHGIMTPLQAIALGVIQGLSEFLPISSSAHLTLLPWLLGWEDPGLAFDVALHWGTLAAVLAIFWRDWIRLLRAALLRQGEPRDARLFWALVVSSIPAALIGKLLDRWAEENLRAPLLIACTLGVMGVVLWACDRAGSKDRGLDQMTLGRALAIGAAQAAALFPGVSRSGSTISVGLAQGFDRESIARFSFLMSTPIIFGAGLLKLPK